MDNDILLSILQHRPEPYEPGDPRFWDDEHISKGMLAAHLDPEMDAATRKPDFVRRSVRWISGFAQGSSPKLLDLGCGPGLYAELFHEAGYDVTGIDFSRRSISYAREQSEKKGSGIEYICDNYLGIAYEGAFDIVTLIYCDFGVLSPENRTALLKKIHQALRPGGRFIVDVCSRRLYENRTESTSWRFEGSGFWSDQPYACLQAFLRYDETNTYADRYVIIRKDNIRCFNIWNHRFSKDELQGDLLRAGFQDAAFYSNVAGNDFTDESDTICAVACR